MLAAVQCGRVARVVAAPRRHARSANARSRALLELFSASRPKPLLDEVARALGPIAAQPGPLAERDPRRRVRRARRAPARPHAGRSPTRSRRSASTRSLPDQDRWLALPARELAAAAAYVLGVAAPHDREAFAPVSRARARAARAPTICSNPSSPAWSPRAHVPACTELAAGLLAAGGEAAATAFALAAALPLDALDDVLLAQLDSELADHRALACAAVELLEGDAIDRALALRLGDPAADVAAAAAHALIERDRRDLIEDHATREIHPVRRAIAAAALGDLSVPVDRRARSRAARDARGRSGRQVARGLSAGPAHHEVPARVGRWARHAHPSHHGRAGVRRPVRARRDRGDRCGARYRRARATRSAQPARRRGDADRDGSRDWCRARHARARACSRTSPPATPRSPTSSPTRSPGRRRRRADHPLAG